MQRTITPLTLDQVVERTEDLPAMVSAALAVVQETSREEATAQSVANKLGQDAALSSRVLRLANSPYYGLSRQVSSVSESIIVLGMRSVKNLCLVAATYPWFTREIPGYSNDPRTLWTHSLATAVGARLLAQKTRSANAEDAFTAGLLHDIGKMALSVCLEGKQFDYEQAGDTPFDEWEAKIFGFDHTEVGSELAIKWNLPLDMVKAIRYHHRPSLAVPPSPIADVVHVAETMASILGLGLYQEGLRYEFDHFAMGRLNLEEQDIEPLAAEIYLSYTQHEKLFEETAKAVGI